MHCLLLCYRICYYVDLFLQCIQTRLALELRKMLHWEWFNVTLYYSVTSSNSYWYNTLVYFHPNHIYFIWLSVALSSRGENHTFISKINNLLSGFYTSVQTSYFDYQNNLSNCFPKTILNAKMINKKNKLRQALHQPLAYKINTKQLSTKKEPKYQTTPRKNLYLLSSSKGASSE